MTGKNRLLAKLVASNDKVTPDSDYVASNVTKTIPAAAGINVYSSIDSLPASTQNGEKALVTSTNTLYIYSNGWYKIAIINAFNPQWITQPDGSYSLALDGSTTSITVLASDSDDVPITYIAITDSDFDAFATIAHDSDKHNVWTVTPTGTSGSYTGTVTFRASDGVNYAQANSTFTLSFSVENTKYQSFLLAVDSDSSDTQVDSSSSNHTITTYLYATGASYSPYHPGGHSVWFDGVGDYLRILNQSNLVVGTNDFSISMWINAQTLADKNLASDIAEVTQDRQYWVLGLRADGSIWFTSRNQDGGTNPSYSSKSATGVIKENTWHHVYAARINNYLYIGIDGVMNVDTAFVTDGGLNKNKNDLIIGGWLYDGYANYSNVFMRDVKYNIRTIEFDLSADSEYTVPTETVTADSDTRALLCSSYYLKHDGSNYNQPITYGGNPWCFRASPYDHLAYSKTDHGGSLYCLADGTGDYAVVTTSSDLTIGDSDFTMEFWFYPTTVDNDYAIIDGRTTNIQVIPWTLYMASNNYLYYYVNGSTVIQSSNNSIYPYSWYHVVVARSGSSTKMFINGTQAGSTYSDTNTYLQGGNIYIARRYTGTAYTPNCYISDLRIVKGRAVYDSDFTPPTSRLTATSDTVLLTCNNDNNNIWDQTGLAVRKTGNTTTAAFAKFASSDSVYFDGNGDAMAASWVPILDLQEDFTIEAWVYFNGIDATQSLAGTYNNGGSSGWLMQYGYVSASDRRLSLWKGGTELLRGDITSSISVSTWHHFAISREGSSLRCFLDGTLINSATDTTSLSSTNPLYIGQLNHPTIFQYFNGYMHDLRVTKGLARYTASFTVPSEPFNG